MQILNSALHLNTDLPFLYIKSLLKKKKKNENRVHVYLLAFVTAVLLMVVLTSQLH